MNEDATLIRLTLETPVSVNDLYIPVGKGKLVLSQAGQDYKDVAGWKAREYMMNRGIDMAARDVEVTMMMEWYRSARRGDLSNLLKCLEDSFTGIVYEDDEQIAHHILDRFTIPGCESRIVVAIWIADVD